MPWQLTNVPFFTNKLIFKRETKFPAKENAEAVTGGVLLEKVFLKISQNSQENIFFTEHIRATALSK